jgi:hypothetical protein
VDVATLGCCLCIRCDPMGVPAVAAGQAMVGHDFECRPTECPSHAIGAVRSARQAPPADGWLRIGLATSPTRLRSVTTAMFLPCQNIGRAARWMAELAERCRRARRSGPLDYCGIAAYRGS